MIGSLEIAHARYLADRAAEGSVHTPPDAKTSQDEPEPAS